MVITEKKYRQVSLPKKLLEQVETYIEKNEAEGFTSVPEFVRQAIRDKLNNHETK